MADVANPSTNATPGVQDTDVEMSKSVESRHDNIDSDIPLKPVQTKGDSNDATLDFKESLPSETTLVEAPSYSPAVANGHILNKHGQTGLETVDLPSKEDEVPDLTIHNQTKEEAVKELTDQTNLLPTRQVISIFFGLSIAIILSFLDQTIISTALPSISGDLGGGKQATWIATSVSFPPFLSTSLSNWIGSIFSLAQQ